MQPITGGVSRMHEDKEIEREAYADYLLKHALVPEKHAPHYVRWVRLFFNMPVATGHGQASEDRIAQFTQGLRRDQKLDWMVEQAERSVRNYLAFLANRKQVAASTQNHAFNALLFLGREGLKVDLGDQAHGVRAKRSTRLPVVMNVEETRKVRGAMRDTPRLMTQAIYGGGLFGGGIDVGEEYHHPLRWRGSGEEENLATKSHKRKKRRRGSTDYTDSHGLKRRRDSGRSREAPFHGGDPRNTSRGGRIRLHRVGIENFAVNSIGIPGGRAVRIFWRDDRRVVHGPDRGGPSIAVHALPEGGWKKSKSD
jgi:hypothetical protein